MRSPTRYACYKKEMLGWIREKMATQESTLGGGRFFTSGQSPLEMAPLLASICALHVGTAQLPLGTVSGTTHIHLTRLTGVKGWVESQVLWCNAHNIQVGALLAKLATLQLMSRLVLDLRREA
jgi:hypothetical protein